MATMAEPGAGLKPIPGKIALDIVTPYGLTVSTHVEEVTATGALGEFGILPGHLPLLSALKPGPLSFKRQGETYRFTVGSGFAEGGADHLVVLVDEFERGEIFALKSLLDWQGHLDVEHTKNAIARGETRLRDLEQRGEEKGEEHAALTEILNQARARLEMR
jgi:F-type H+-transporting ATPase subunit epsilon